MTDLENVDRILQLYRFSNELGEPITFTPGQRDIMAPIINLGAGGKQFVQIETPTRYGKSASIAAALTTRCTRREQWAIIAGTSEKAQIIMDYFIGYALENAIPRALLKVSVPLDKLKQERSRRSLTFSSGFEVRVYSADSRNKQEAGNAVMGFGAPFVILDEAALVSDVVEGKVFRMIAGFASTRHVYIKVGNPFHRNHFLKSHNDPDFHLIWFDYRRGIAEGRLTEAYVEKARKKPNFDVLYEVKFPDADAVDDRGWSPLVTEEDVRACFVTGGSGFGFLKAGCDPSGEGTNFNTAVLRYRNYARILLKERLLDQFRYTERMVAFHKHCRETEQMAPMGYWVDRVGVGEGHYQTMRRDLENVWGVNVGLPASDGDGFVNLRAEAYWRLRTLVKTRQILLEADEDWLQLTTIRYRTRLEGKRGKVEIMSKDEMRANGFESPDVADGLMLTCTTPDPFDTLPVEEAHRVSSFDRYAAFNEL